MRFELNNVPGRKELIHVMILIKINFIVYIMVSFFYYCISIRKLHVFYLKSAVAIIFVNYLFWRGRGGGGFGIKPVSRYP